jgi:diguanylate cyclase (GGDEF)-like protein
VVEEFAERLAKATSPRDVRSALARAAGRLAGGAQARFDREAVGAAGALVVPLRFGGRVVGTLRLVPDRPREWPSALARTVESMAALASAAEQALGLRARPPAAPSLGLGEPSRDPVTGLHSSAFLEAYLAHALALAARRREPLALLVLEPDGLAEFRRRDGAEFADSALGLVARAVVATLRASDVVARLAGADRLAAVLPSASGSDALKVAEVLRRAVAEAGVASAAPTALTASIGLAAFPDDARDPASLLASARAALHRARSAGGDCVSPAQSGAPAAELQISMWH